MPSVVKKSVVAQETLQQQHYDRIAEKYRSHYSDPTSQEYMDRFVYAPLFEGVALGDTRVLEAMCGSGQVTSYLVSRNARVVGLDISPVEVSHFKHSWPQLEAVCRPIRDTGFQNGSFDAVVIIGGLHHTHPGLTEALTEIHRILRPGGLLLFMEPHAGSLPNLLRRAWYWIDPLFQKNEAAIDVRQIRKQFESRFDLTKISYRGNVAYLFVLNSLVFRLPLSWKRHYAKFAFRVETLLQRFQGQFLSCYVVTQWEKKS